MYGIDELRNIIPTLSRGLELMRSKPMNYCHSFISLEDSPCGTQCCTGGWIGAANGLCFTESYAQVTPDFSPWRNYLFFGVGPSQGLMLSELPHHLLHDGLYDTAVDRLTKYIEYLRRRLAIMEVEAGHWDDDSFITGDAWELHLEAVLS